MSEPTREQLIQQANLRADYNEAKARGERWEMEKRPWGCEEWTTKFLGTSPAWCPEYEYRRTPEPKTCPKCGEFVAFGYHCLSSRDICEWYEDIQMEDYHSLLAERDRLKAIVDQLPKTADGVRAESIRET